MTKCKTSLFMIFLLVTLLFQWKESGAETRERYKRTVEKYAVPDVTLVNQDGKKIKLNAILKSKKVVMVDFIFTTCTTICPILSAEFSSFQEQIGADPKDVQLVSISIDPEHDTPKKMKEYLKRYDAKPGWDFYTGQKGDIVKVLKALDAYTPDKMSHMPLALLYSSSNNQWVRVYGLLGTSDLLAEYRKVSGR
jgi:protein SCO1/2